MRRHRSSKVVVATRKRAPDRRGVEPHSLLARAGRGRDAEQTRPYSLDGVSLHRSSVMMLCGQVDAYPPGVSRTCQGQVSPASGDVCRCSPRQIAEEDQNLNSHA